MRNTSADNVCRQRDVLCANTVPTAQAALQILLEELPVCLADARVLVIGMGRIGRILVQELEALGSEVCAASRHAARTVHTVPTGAYGDALTRCDAVVNTAPALVLDAAALSQLPPSCLVLDLASAPGGVDASEAKRRGIRLRWEQGLPGRMFPVSAGRIVRDAVLRAVKEEET